MSVPRPAKLNSRPHLYVEPQTSKSTAIEEFGLEFSGRPNPLQLLRLRLGTPPESTETPPNLYHIQVVRHDIAPLANPSASHNAALRFFSYHRRANFRKGRRMAISGGNSFKTRDTLNVGAQAFEIHRLEHLEKQGIAKLATLPFSLRVLLENLASL